MLCGWLIQKYASSCVLIYSHLVENPMSMIEAIEQVFDRYGEVVSETAIKIEATHILSRGNMESDLEKYKLECMYASEITSYLRSADSKYGVRRGRDGGLIRHYLPDRKVYQDMCRQRQVEAETCERYGIIANPVILPNL